MTDLELQRRVLRSLDGAQEVAQPRELGAGQRYSRGRIGELMPAVDLSGSQEAALGGLGDVRARVSGLRVIAGCESYVRAKATEHDEQGRACRGADVAWV